MKLVILYDTWMYCTNGYPDPDVVRTSLCLIMGSAQKGIRASESPMLIQGQSDLYAMCRDELEMMGDKV